MRLTLRLTGLHQVNHVLDQQVDLELGGVAVRDGRVGVAGRAGESPAELLGGDVGLYAVQAECVLTRQHPGVGEGLQAHGALHKVGQVVRDRDGAAGRHDGADVVVLVCFGLANCLLNIIHDNITIPVQTLLTICCSFDVDVIIQDLPTVTDIPPVAKQVQST